MTSKTDESSVAGGNVDNDFETLECSAIR